jgi:hypothetical protein
VKAEKAPEAGKGGKFDSAAKSAASSNQSGAEKNKKFTESAKLQKHIDLFKKGVRSLATDSKTSKDAEKFLKKFDEISSYLKPRMESVEPAGVPEEEPIDAKASKLLETIHKFLGLNEDRVLGPVDAVNKIKEAISTTGV